MRRGRLSIYKHAMKKTFFPASPFLFLGRKVSLNKSRNKILFFFFFRKSSFENITPRIIYTFNNTGSFQTNSARAPRSPISCPLPSTACLPLSPVFLNGRPRYRCSYQNFFFFFFQRSSFRFKIFLTAHKIRREACVRSWKIPTLKFPLPAPAFQTLWTRLERGGGCGTNRNVLGSQIFARGVNAREKKKGEGRFGRRPVGNRGGIGVASGATLVT